MYRPVLVTAPVIKPVTLAEVKAALDIGYSEKDTLITGLIAAATSYLDGWTGILGRALCEQTWRQDYDGWCSKFRLPLFPVISIGSVKYIDTSGVEQTVTSTNYTLKNDDLGAYVEFITTYALPSVGVEPAGVRVAYLAGYADIAGSPKTSSVPDNIKQGMFLLIRHWFDNPSAVNVGNIVNEVPMGAAALFGISKRARF
ncbi:phage head-tail connector protein [Bradyrhizobium sp. AUGA SZCCT0176]|uniref:head-tail connector protein n=1 Tax=Bradyrhizobium sp. AUGA SZCCT0176 TaxID=2807664 RepID=UPI001BA84569|nr:phage head-tail connector protein [Bradyrhizobium sp. AUGA SZCCT0176]MBR1230209.1 phage head-tail connector protein [Bradyrhizobium sp. AUGA SZCCT0176]